MFELTIRQREIAELAADGHTDAEIATKLDLHISTVRDHVWAIRTKLGGIKKREIGRALKAQKGA